MLNNLLDQPQNNIEPKGNKLVAFFKELFRFDDKDDRKSALADYRAAISKKSKILDPGVIESLSAPANQKPVSKEAAIKPIVLKNEPKISAVGAAPSKGIVLKNTGKSDVVADDAKTNVKDAVEFSSLIGTNLVKNEVTVFFDWKANGFFALACLVVSIIMIVIMNLGIMAINKMRLAGLNEESSEATLMQANIEQLKKDINGKNIGFLNAKLSVAKDVLNNHIYWTPFFDFLERTVVADAYITSFTGDNKGEYTLEFIVKDLATLLSQIQVLKDSPDVVAGSVDLLSPNFIGVTAPANDRGSNRNTAINPMASTNQPAAPISGKDSLSAAEGTIAKNGTMSFQIKFKVDPKIFKK